MTRLDRRSLLLAATLVATQASMPEWLAHAFGFAGAQDPASREPQEKLSAWRREQLRDAATTARQLSRPLLVLLVPEDAQRHAVGQWYGAFFWHAAADAMFDATLGTLVCATADELKAELGTTDANVAAPKQGVAMLLVDLPATAKAAPSRITRIEPELELVFAPTDAKPGKQGMRGGDPELDRAEHAWRERGIARMAAALHDGLQRHAVDRGQQAATVAAALRATEQKQVQAWLREGGELRPAQLLRMAPLLQQQIAELPKERRAAMQEELARQLRTALTSQRVPGSVWGDATCPPCGMARVAPLCGRFLDFYSQPTKAK